MKALFAKTKSLLILLALFVLLNLFAGWLQQKGIEVTQDPSSDNTSQQTLKGENLKLDETTQLPEKNDFPPSQRSIDGFFIGQHINAVLNTLGKPDKTWDEDGGTIYSYWLAGEAANPTFLAFEVYNPESGIIGAIQLTGDHSDKETFLELKLGDSKEKVISSLGKPSKIEPGTRNSDLYIYGNKNYTVELSKEGKLFSIRLAGLSGFAENLEIGDFINNFKNALNSKDINKISEFLMPDAEIYIGDNVFKITKRFLDELLDPGSGVLNNLLFAQNSVKNTLNKYNGEIDMQLRITEKGPSGYVYKFIESKILEEIFVVEHAGKWRVYEIKYRSF